MPTLNVRRVEVPCTIVGIAEIESGPGLGGGGAVSSLMIPLAKARAIDAVQVTGAQSLLRRNTEPRGYATLTVKVTGAAATREVEDAIKKLGYSAFSLNDLLQGAKRVFLILDIVRGFALVGVLIANMVSFNSQQIPDDVLTAVSTPADRLLLDINAVFIEWKFMTLFSILFGYSFGLIISSVERRQDDPVAFFIRRMGWLFLIGLVHTSFWVYDVLHLYAVSGLLLLPFRRASRRPGTASCRPP